MNSTITIIFIIFNQSEHIFYVVTIRMPAWISTWYRAPLASLTKLFGFIDFDVYGCICCSCLQWLLNIFVLIKYLNTKSTISDVRGKNLNLCSYDCVENYV